MADYDVIIIGAGMAGLSCALSMEGSGKRFLIIEASDAVGGRVRTDKVEGYILDRGFQVLLTAYPSIRTLCDYDQLNLHHFMSGAVIQKGPKRVPFFDPLRHPNKALSSALSSAGTLRDKWLLSKLRNELQDETISSIFSGADDTTLNALRRYGFSTAIIDSFFRPFIGGVTLDPGISGSVRFFRFVMKMFAEGTASIPEQGMQAIPQQLADTLPADTLRLNTRVDTINDDGTVLCENGERYTASKVVLATDGASAAKVYAGIKKPVFHTVDCMYFGCDTPPIKEAALLLNADKEGVINNLAVMSNVCPTYAPSARHLVSVSILNNQGLSSGELETKVRQEADKWFGQSVRAWRMLRHYHIRHALPRYAPKEDEDIGLIVSGKVVVAGDHRSTSSLHGACLSGQAAADHILSA